MRSMKAYEDALIYCKKEAEIQKKRILERQRSDHFKAQISIAKGNVSSLQEDEFVKELNEESKEENLNPVSNPVGSEAHGWSKLKNIISKSPLLKGKGNLLNLEDENLNDDKVQDGLGNDFKELNTKMQSIDSKISNIFKLYERAGIKRDDEEKKGSDESEEHKGDRQNSSPNTKQSPLASRGSIVSLTNSIGKEKTTKDNERRLSHGNFFNLVKLQNERDRAPTD